MLREAGACPEKMGEIEVDKDDSREKGNMGLLQISESTEIQCCSRSHGEPPNRTHQEQVYDSLEEEHPSIVDIRSHDFGRQ